MSHPFRGFQALQSPLEGSLALEDLRLLHPSAPEDHLLGKSMEMICAVGKGPESNCALASKPQVQARSILSWGKRMLAAESRAARARTLLGQRRAAGRSRAGTEDDGVGDEPWAG